MPSPVLSPTSGRLLGLLPREPISPTSPPAEQIAISDYWPDMEPDTNPIEIAAEIESLDQDQGT